MIRKYQNKDWLKKKYLEEKLSMNEIGKICGVWKTTIGDWLDKFNIKKDKKDKKYMHRDWLIEHYINQKLSTIRIGNICGAAASTINIYLRKLDIPIRSLSEAFLGITRKRTKKHNQKISEANKGKILSKETKSKIRQSLIGYFEKYGVSQEIREKIRKATKGKFVSEETRNKIRGKNNYFYGKHFYRENNYNWKNGATNLLKVIRNLKKMEEWRNFVFKRDNYKCHMCGDDKGHNLNAHHIKSLSELIQYYEITTTEEANRCREIWAVNNGITLCEKCHMKIHKKKVLINV